MCPVSCLSNGNLCYVIDISFPGWVLNLNLKTDVKTCPGISLSGTTEKNESTLRTARQLWFILARWLRLEMKFIVTYMSFLEQHRVLDIVPCVLVQDL